MKNFFTIHLWFDMYAGPLTTPFRYTLIGVTIAFVLLLAYAARARRAHKKTLYRRTWEQIYSLSITGIILGLAMLFFTSHRIPFFSMRIWFAIWALAFIGWGYFIYRKRKELPAIEKDLAKKREFKKYTP